MQMLLRNPNFCFAFDYFKEGAKLFYFSISLLLKVLQKHEQFRSQINSYFWENRLVFCLLPFPNMRISAFCLPTQINGSFPLFQVRTNLFSSKRNAQFFFVQTDGHFELAFAASIF